MEAKCNNLSTKIVKMELGTNYFQLDGSRLYPSFTCFRQRFCNTSHG